MKKSGGSQYKDKDGSNIVCLAQKFAIGTVKPICDSDMFKLYEMVDQNGGHLAMYALGQCHQFGLGTFQNIKESIRCYAKAAVLGSFEALWQLYSLRDEESLQTDLIVVYQLFINESKKNNPKAQLDEGFCLYCGIGVEANRVAAQLLFLKASKGGCADALYMLELCRQEGIGDGYYWKQGAALLQYAATNGSSEAQFQLGWAYWDMETAERLDIKQDYGKAAQCFSLAAYENHAQAAHNLAWCYCAGQGVQRDLNAAFNWWMKAALLGNGSAASNISCLYRHIGFDIRENDYPVSVDYYEALFWAIKAATQGDVQAKNGISNILKHIGLPLRLIELIDQQPIAFSAAELLFDTAECYQFGRGVTSNETIAFHLYIISAKLGCSDAQAAVAKCYQQGIGTAINHQESVCWNARVFPNEQIAQELKQLFSIQDNNLQALLFVVKCEIRRSCETQQIMQCNDSSRSNSKMLENTKAFEKLKQSAKYNVEAKCQMILRHQCSSNAEKDFAGFPQQLKKEAASGNAEINYCLARCYILGLGTQVNQAQAINFYELAAEKNYPAAQYELGYCYQEGIVVERSFYKAIELYNRAAEWQYIPALKALAGIYESDDYEMKDLNRAFQYRKRAAELGDADEQLRVAECYKDGIGVERDDREALCWFQKAAHNGKYECYKYIAECYDQGMGTKVDQESAFETYRRLAAALPTKENLIILAERLEKGKGTQRDVAAAIQCYQQTGAHSNLGDIYFTGNGVPRSLKTALTHYTKAKEFSLGQLQNIICAFKYRRHLRGDGLFYFKILKLAANELRSQIGWLNVRIQ